MFIVDIIVAEMRGEGGIMGMEGGRGGGLRGDSYNKGKGRRGEDTNK